MLKINNVSFSYGDVDAVHNVSLDIQEGEIVCLLGPSGCGKTTLLRIITGLETGYTGEIIFNNRDMKNIPVYERDFGLMFQDFALFPHMSVADNIAYGLKRKGNAKNDIHNQVTSLLEQVGLTGFEDRDINMLSGGQKQRVALARSLAPNPQLLMLDEPLGSLDALLRDQLIVELRETIKSVGLTAIYVTHDQKEAFSIADRIVVMNAGQIEQIDTPQQIYNFPKSAFVARFFGLSNIFQIDESPLITRLVEQSSHDFTNADKVLIHPNGIGIHQQTGDSLLYSAIVETVIFRGEYSLVAARLTDDVLLRFNVVHAHIEREQVINLNIAPQFILPL